ncbi:MAG: Crp/Fnr family transcriptional regulator [Candidatus Acidiferrum sp.]
MSFDESNEKPDCLLLESCELFAGIPSDIRIKVMNSATTRYFERRQKLFFMGEPVGKVLLLVEGCVKLTQFTERGDEVILRLQKPGEVVGRPDWAPGELHSYTAQALQECRVLVWDARTLQTAKEVFPQLQRNVNKLIGSALNKLQLRYCAIATGEVRTRLAQGVLQVLEEIGQKVNSHVEICLSQEELGQMTGVSHWAVCRELTKWEQEGLVTGRRGVIEVQNVPGLLSLCRAN